LKIPKPLVIRTEASARDLVNHLTNLPGPFAIDCETVGIDPSKQSPVYNGRMVCFSLAWDSDNGIHTAVVDVGNLPTFAKWLKSVALVGHNIFGFDRHIFANHSVLLGNITHDTMLMSRLARNSNFMRHGLKPLALEYLGLEMDDFKKTFSRPLLGPVLTRAKVSHSKRKGIPTTLGTSWQVIPKKTELIPLDEVFADPDHPKYNTLIHYAALDAYATLLLLPVMADLLKKLPGNKEHETGLEVYENVWHQQMYPVYEAERNGLYLDPELCALAVLEYQAEVKPKRIALRRWFGRDVNIKSFKQLQEFLYEEKGFQIPPINGSPKAIKRTKPGEKPTSEVAIRWLTQNYDVGPLGSLPIIKRAARDIHRLKTFPSNRDRFGRIHYQLAPKTATGRLSASNLPIQQVPKFGVLRTAFRAEPGHKLIVADYSQLEMRVLAHFLIKLFDDHDLANDLATGDLHAITAERLGCDRDFAKAINFSINYGKSKYGLAAQLGITVEHAAGLLRNYHESYPGVRRFQLFCESFALRTGYVQTLLGRVRFIPELSARDNKALYGIGYRKAINTPVQGSAADVVVHAMIACYNDQSLRGLEAAFCGQIHDELIFRVPTANADAAAARVTLNMEQAYALRVPLPVGCKVADSWGEGK